MAFHLEGITSADKLLPVGLSKNVSWITRQVITAGRHSVSGWPEVDHSS
jgi:hypothetical protein